MALAFEALSFAVDGRVRQAAVWLPPGYDRRDDWPLVVYLHGYGERGDSHEHADHGLAVALAAHPERFPCVVLMPQCPTDLVWVVVDEPWARGHGGAEAHIDAALAATLAHFAVDRHRVALTGLSMGGFGTLVYGAARAGSFRAMVAICGGGRVEDAARLASVPLWVLHGDSDDVVPVDRSRRIAAAVRAAEGSAPFRYTEYPGVGHASWERAYADPDVAAFLLEPW